MSMSLLYWGVQNDPVLQLWSNQCWVGGEGSKAPRISGALCLQAILIAHAHIGVHKDLQVLCCKSAFQLIGPNMILVCGIILLHTRDFKLPLVELHEVPVRPSLLHAKVHPAGSTTLWYTSHFPTFVSSANFLCGSKSLHGKQTRRS